MDSQSDHLRHLAFASPTPRSHYFDTSPQPSHRHPKVEPSSRSRHTATRHPRRQIIHQGDVGSHLDDVPHITWAKSHSGSLVAWQYPEVPAALCHQAAMDRWDQANIRPSTRQLQIREYSKVNQKHMSQADPEDRKKDLLSPPVTPQLRRLKTPELGPFREEMSFCTCCHNRDMTYQMGREKMDSQR